MTKRRMLAAIGLSILAAGLAIAAPGRSPHGRIELVVAGQARAVVVLPENPLPAQQFAARELVEHVRQATGVALPVCAETAPRAKTPFTVYVGPCAAARAAGLDAETLAPSAYVVKTLKDSLFLLGRDRDRGKVGHYWTADWQGTLYAVYDFLENELGVRWLWPGELGEHVPRRAEIVVAPADRRGQPRFRQAWLRTAGSKDRARPGWSSAEAHAAYHEAQRLFLLRHRFGAVENLDYGHAFAQYWKRFAKSHPEFFNKLPDGSRRPLDGFPGGDRITMCVSEPGFWKQVVADWARKSERRPENIPYRPYVNACENDTPGMCTCARCRAWDAPDPGFASHAYWGRGIIPPNNRRFTIARTPWGELKEGDAGSTEPPSVSDRYARFYAELLREARKVDPAARVAGYAYANYWKAPVNPGLDLNGVLVIYVPAVGFPYTAKMSEEFRANWDGWRRRGAEMILRPNLTHAGANLPIFYARQLAADFSYAAAQGMIGTAFDSLLGAWAAQGPTLYTLARIHEHPDWPVDRILDEYYAAFGPAEAGVRAYFGYWERHSDNLDPERVSRYNAEEEGGGFKNYVRIAHRLFAPSDFQAARALLDEAQRQARGDPRAARRVAYLEQGLTDAELTTAARAAQAAAEKHGNAEDRATFEAAFRRLLAHRADMEARGEFAANLGYFAFRECYGSKWPHQR